MAPCCLPACQRLCAPFWGHLPLPACLQKVRFQSKAGKILNYGRLSEEGGIQCFCKQCNGKVRRRRRGGSTGVGVGGGGWVGWGLGGGKPEPYMSSCAR